VNPVSLGRLGYDLQKKISPPGQMCTSGDMFLTHQESTEISSNAQVDVQEVVNNPDRYTLKTILRAIFYAQIRNDIKSELKLYEFLMGSAVISPMLRAETLFRTAQLYEKQGQDQLVEYFVNEVLRFVTEANLPIFYIKLAKEWMSRLGRNKEKAIGGQPIIDRRDDTRREVSVVIAKPGSKVAGQSAHPVDKPAEPISDVNRFRQWYMRFSQQLFRLLHIYTLDNINSLVVLPEDLADEMLQIYDSLLEKIDLQGLTNQVGQQHMFVLLTNGFRNDVENRKLIPRRMKALAEFVKALPEW
jgi:hypothetical protein